MIPSSSLTMDLSSPASTTLPCPPLEQQTVDDDHKKEHAPSDQYQSSSFFIKQQPQPSSIPREFVWAKGGVGHAREELREPVVDLSGFFRGDEVATQHAAMLVRAACLNHGFFQVINHGVDPHLITAAYNHMEAFFKLPLSKKLRAQRKPGTLWGYSGAHTDRFSLKLPWKETLSFGFHETGSGSVPVVEDFFKSSLGEEFEQTGLVYQKYCEAMKELSLVLMEVLGMSLGVDRRHYREFFKDGNSIMRCNYYPPCQEPGLAYGTGPHCDPTSLTILHQDQVGGLEVFVNNKWTLVRPRPHALVINLGDTFKALTNGRYKSCLHRAVVNRYKERRSLVFFVCPREEKVVRPPQDLVCREGTRKYPDFTWSQLLLFTQKYYRADDATPQNFTNWLLSFSTPSN